MHRMMQMNDMTESITTMKHLLLATVAVIALALGAGSTCIAGELTPLVKQFSGEVLQSEVRADYDLFQNGAEAERLRKAKAGERPLTSPTA